MLKVDIPRKKIVNNLVDNVVFFPHLKIIIVYKLVRYYDRTYTKKCFNGLAHTSNFGDYETEYFYGYPDKYLELPVISYMVRNELTTILVYGGNR